MKWMSTQFPGRHHLELPDGSHMAMHDDTERCFEGLIGFLRKREQR